MMNIDAAPLLDLHPAVLRSFLAVAAGHSFTAAAARLELRQSTVSQHVRRLEDAVGRRLLLRDTHSVALTADGETMVELARGVLDGYDRMRAVFAGKEVRHRLRLGISEDFAMSRLAHVLIEFGRDEPNVDIELTVGLSGYLYQRFDAGDLDVIFAKRKPGDKRGRTAWRERLTWIARRGLYVPPHVPVPLVAFSPPSITRSLAIEAFQAAGRSWRLSCSSGSLNGLRAALVAGLGVAAHSGRLIPHGVAPLAPETEMPRLPHVEFVAIGPGRTHPLAMRMVDMLVDNSGNFRQLRDLPEDV